MLSDFQHWQIVPLYFKYRFASRPISRRTLFRRIEAPSLATVFGAGMPLVAGWDIRAFLSPLDERYTCRFIGMDRSLFSDCRWLLMPSSDNRRRPAD